jgi:hypothetical protein
LFLLARSALTNLSLLAEVADTDLCHAQKPLSFSNLALLMLVLKTILEP